LKKKPLFFFLLHLFFTFSFYLLHFGKRRKRGGRGRGGTAECSSSRLVCEIMGVKKLTSHLKKR
jgi:hypothetical protein